jgi:hypothetical protein
MARPSSRLATSPSSRCEHCDRDTKTVSGAVCAECWRAKQPGAPELFRAEPRTWRVFDVWHLNELDLGTWLVIAALLAIAAVVLRLLLA